MKTLRIKTRLNKEVVDITDAVQDTLKEAGKTAGVCHLFLSHTTAALTTADLDPGTDKDILEAFQEMVPRLAYRHPHDPAHVSDHILSALVGTSLTVPVSAGTMVLGTWQRVVLIEFDGPREREVIVSFVSEE